MQDRAQTVLGPVSGEDLGFTLPHEHLVFDGSAIFTAPAAVPGVEYVRGRPCAAADWR